ETAMWMNAPLAGIAGHLQAALWARVLITVLVVVASVLVLAPAAHAALEDAEQLLFRISMKGGFPDIFGRAIDMAAASAALIIVLSGGEITWLSRAYGTAVAVTLLLKLAALIRLRRLRPGPRTYTSPLTLHIGGREIPIGLAGLALVLVGGVLA